ncbi:hypothetical protein JCM9140_3554 [Halalkalibacter wakoensis JCM 9140]|uniref:Serine aminopeptidase S33 domain-containing protein n=1 Tax=Halalkalibacter wakoensis JCM 9140 TaxID=1236970 RepID=W4Q7T7_9BACI|nr:alpha/beta hydrolase [Halalkalibacter wakoensis]GAE27409.1 hypothetical protein JCM9140_3554 [Halalkalibacter wakoensis JCM 9140]
MKKLLLLAGGILAIGILAYGFVGNYFYNFALDVEEEKEFLDDNPHLAESEAVLASVAEEAKIADELFKKETKLGEWQITSTDKLHLQLHADVYENERPTNKWAVVVHGYTSSASSMTRYARHFYEKEYHVVVPDLRGHGNSEGHYIGMGWHDRLDLLQWVNLIIEKDPNAEIVLFGISMGGATVMMASGEESLPDNVKVIVQDCGYSSVSDVFIYQLDDLFGLPEFPIMNAANTVTKWRAGYDLYEASAVDQVAKSDTPMLFIHGDADTFVPYEMLDEVYRAATVEKEKLIIEGAGHGDAEKVDPELYWNTVWSFVERYID